MAVYRFTRRAEADFLDIGEYSRRTWGDEQCARYLGQLEDCCQRLADHRTLGRPCDKLGPGVRRGEQGRHVVFYRREGDDILVLRILHERMLPKRHLGKTD
jgi:toxin ParE1/3/4